MFRFGSLASAPSSLLLLLLLSACGGEKPAAMLASARDYMAKNDPKAAAIQIKNALQKDPAQPEARYLLGLALLSSGDAAGGETELRKAMELKHPQELLVPALAQALLAQRQYKKLTQEFATSDFKDVAARASLKTSLAMAHAAQGEVDLSRAALDAALAADATYAPALLMRARLLAARREFDSALATIDTIFATAPGDYEAWKLKGDILLHAKSQSAEALVAYRKSVDVKSDYVEGHGAILSSLLGGGKLDEASEQLELLKKASPNSAQARYFATLLAYQKKDFKLARELAQQMIKGSPENPMCLQLAGAIELQANSLLQAEAYLDKAIKAAPGAVLARRLLILTYLQSGQPEKALATLQPALLASPDAATLATAGQVYLQNGDVKKAEAYFAKAAQQDPQNTRTRTALALTHLAAGRSDEALAELQDIAGLDKGLNADLALVSTHLRRGEFDRALKAIDGLQKKQPERPLADNLRGRVLLAKKDLAGARKSFEQSLAIDPLFFPSVASLAALDMGEKKPDEARKRFEALLAKDRKNVRALLALAELKARAGAKVDEVAELISRAIAENPGETPPRLLLVELYLRGNEPRKAVAAGLEAVAALPNSPEVHDALGRAQQTVGDMSQALASYRRVVELQPRSAFGHVRLANAHMAAKDKDAAAQSLRKALEVKPDLLDAQRGLIMLAVDARDYQQAVGIARSIQKQRPKEPVGYQFEGDISVNQGKWELAAEAYRFGLTKAPAAELAAKLHATLGKQGKTTEQERLQVAWLKEHPGDVIFPLYLGDTAVLRKDYAGAESLYRKVTQMQASNALALNNLAWVSGRLKKDGAIAYAERAVALVPDQPAFMDTLAMLLSEKEDYAKALEWQTKALALQAQNPTFRLNLVRIHLRGGKKDLARKELDAMAKLGDKFPAQAEVATLLKSL